MLRLLALGAFLALALVACAGDANPAEDPSPTPSASATPTSTPEPPPIGLFQSQPFSPFVPPNGPATLLDPSELYLYIGDAAPRKIASEASLGLIAFSPDSTRLAYVVQHIPASAEVRIADADREILTAVVEGMADALSWSPSGGWLGILTSNNAERRLLALKTDGTQLVLLDRTVAPDGNIVMADWISEGVLLATRGTHTSQLMAAYDLNSMTGRLIAPDFPVRADFMSEPSVSPNGRQIGAVRMESPQACSHLQEVFGSIWIIDAVTGSAEQLVPPVCQIARLAWSPDGSRFAYTNASADPNISGVYVLDLQENTPRRVSPGLGRGELKWTADGRSLISVGHTCLQCDDPRYWPVLIDPSGGGERVLAEVHPSAITDSGTLAAYVDLDGGLLINNLNTGHTDTPMGAHPDWRIDAVAWAPDSSLLAFTRTTSFGSRYFEVNADGTGLERLVPSGGIDTAYYHPAPSGDRAAYGVREENGTETLWLSDSDGASAVQVDLAVPSTPKWSPTGEMLVVKAYGSDYQASLFIVSSDGTILRSIGPTVVGSDQVAWSPDGRYLAVPGWTLDIYDLKSDASVSIPAQFAWDVQWSADGAQLAFADERTNGQFDILLVNPDGSQLRAVTSDPAPDYSPAFSPDASRLVFRRSYLGGEQYHILDLETGAERALIAEAPNGGPAIWLADGGRFLTAATLPAGRGLWSVDPVSGTAELLVESANGVGSIHWLNPTRLYFSITQSGM